MQLHHICEKRMNFLSDDFSVVKFWFDRKAQFPDLYEVPMRVLATPVSSSASERVFSALKLLVTEKRSRLTPSIIDDMVTVRALHQ